MSNSFINIGKKPVYRGVYNVSTKYYSENMVAMCACLFQCAVPSIVGVPPITIDTSGNASFANTSSWNVVIDNLALYNNINYVEEKTVILREIVDEFIVTISDDWKKNTDYVVGNYVIKGGALYKCVADHNSGNTFNNAKWKQTTIANMVNDIINAELTEFAGEVFETKDTTVESPQYEEGFMYTDGRITSNTSYGIVKPIEMLKGDTIILNLGNGIYHGYGAAVLFKCSSDGTFIESLISGSGTSTESWTNNTGNTIYVGICAYKAQTGYIIRRKIALKTSLNEIRDSFGHADSLSFDVAAGSTTPTSPKMDVDIAASDTFYLKVSDTIGDGNSYELYFVYEGQSSGTGVGTILSGSVYKFTASQNIDKINIWKRAVSTDKTVRIDVWTGLLGQINLTESNLSTLKNASVRQAILSEAYTITSVTRNTSSNVTAASIVYPDGVTGTMSVTRNVAGAATSVVYTYGTSTYTLTITRDSSNNVTATSLS